MTLADVHHVLVPLAAAGEKSKTAFYIAGGVLAAWAVLVSVIGITRPDFPVNVLGSRAVMGISFVLVVTTMVLAVATASKPAKESEAKASEGGAKAPPAGGPSVPGGPGAPVAPLQLAADPSGQLKYEQTSLDARAGPVAIDFTNQSPVAHNVTIQQGSKNVAASQTITSSKTVLVAKLAPGKYTYYCSVDGHRQAGMVGTLTVR